MIILVFLSIRDIYRNRYDRTLGGQKMVFKEVQCPSCGEIIPISGIPGEVKKITCPRCKTIGKVTFSGNVLSKNAAITVENLRKEYGDLVAVNDISFSVKKGEVFAFLGPNGAGKTTTVEMIESIRQPTSGSITLLGHDIKTSFDKVKEYIGILPQEFHSFERLTVYETLEYFWFLFKKKADINEIMDAMDLQAHRKKLYKQLSGGLKQRVGVAISLVNDPDIIFLDEPTTGLDPKARREVWDVIKTLKTKGKTVFLTTHYMEEAEFLADHIAIIHKGKIIAEGTLDDLIQNYGHGSILHIYRCSNNGIVDILKEKGYTILSKQNGNISISIDFTDKILDILSILRHEAVEYQSIDIHRPNLEEIFLHLTGAKLQGENA